MKKVGTTLPFLILYWNNQWLFRTIEDTDRVKVVQNIRKLCPTPQYEVTQFGPYGIDYHVNAHLIS